jgi:hypothetical protein
VTNSDMGVVWGLLCLHRNTIKPSYGSQAKFVRHIVFALFLIIIIIIIIIILIVILPHMFVRSIARKCLDQTL